MALNIVRVRIFWTSDIFVIIVFPYTHDTGAVIGMEPGVEESPVTQDNCSTSIGKPRDAEQLPS